MLLNSGWHVYTAGQYKVEAASAFDWSCNFASQAHAEQIARVRLTHLAAIFVAIASVSGEN